MNKVHLFYILLFITLINNAQIVNIPDANFKNALLNHNPVIDTNNDNQIQVSEALATTFMQVSYKSINNLDGIQSFSNLEELRCSGNNLATLDLGFNTQLTLLYCSNNQITSLNTTLNTNLNTLNCSLNQISNLDTSQNLSLVYLVCGSNLITNLSIAHLTLLEQIAIDNNQITDFDISNNTNLILIYLDNNPYLTYINLKNGNNSNIYVDLGHNGISIINCNNLERICVDDTQSTFVTNLNTIFNLSCTYTEYCSLTPALNNEINGNVKFDTNNNGCDNTDISTPNLMLITDNGSERFATFTQTNGDFNLFTNEGDFTTNITTNLPNYWSTTPSTLTNTFTGYNHVFTGDFCITANQTINDVSISVFPINAARPGFETSYKLILKNEGTTQLSGTVVLDFDATLLNFSTASTSTASQTANSLTFNYTDLNPFQTNAIIVNFNVSANANLDDVLNFNTTINPINGDNTPENNTYILNQNIVNSYDPNDIHILEGPRIKFENVNQYVHYLIRFQNIGNADAINVVVKNELDPYLDWTTLQLMYTSHNTRVNIHNENDVEFIFENINLPGSMDNEESSHGYIAYKIKLKNNIAIGDIIPNQAKIFFDYNEAINTNITSTTITDNTNSINSNILNKIRIQPNPTNGLININAKDIQIVSLKIYSNLGQLILSKSGNSLNSINLEKLTKGIYILKLEDVKGNSIAKKIVLE